MPPSQKFCDGGDGALAVLPAAPAVGVLALRVVRLAAVAAAARLPLGLPGGAQVGDRVREAVGLGARPLVAVGLEIGLLGHYAHILSESNEWSCNHLSASASIKTYYIR